MLDELNQMIAELEEEEKRTSQKLEKKRREIKRAKLQKKQLGERAEKKRLHKMIVLGSTICTEIKKWGGGEELYDSLLNRDDKAMVKLACMLTDTYHKHNNQKQ